MSFLRKHIDYLSGFLALGGVVLLAALFGTSHNSSAANAPALVCDHEVEKDPALLAQVEAGEVEVAECLYVGCGGLF